MIDRLIDKLNDVMAWAEDHRRWFSWLGLGWSSVSLVRDLQAGHCGHAAWHGFLAGAFATSLVAEAAIGCLVKRTLDLHHAVVEHEHMIEVLQQRCNARCELINDLQKRLTQVAELTRGKD